MLRLILIIIAVIFSISFTISKNTFSQTTDGGADTSPQQMQQPSGGAQGTTIIQEETQPPWFFYWPQENLNPFDKSTLGDSLGPGGMESGSTLGRTRNRPSNLEVNPPPRRIEENDVGSSMETNIVPLEENLRSEEPIIVGSPPSPGKGGPIYKWVDDEGVIQVTNDPASVPPQYLDQALSESEETDSE